MAGRGKAREIAVFTKAMANRLVAAMKLVESFRMSGDVVFRKGNGSMTAHVRHGGRGGGGGRGVRFRVKEEFNNWLRCRQVQLDDTELEVDVLIAKVPELRHEAKWYQAVTALTTTSPEMVEATGDGESQTWRVNHPYVPDVTEIWADRPEGGTGLVDDDDEPILWLDQNRASRAWALEA